MGSPQRAARLILLGLFISLIGACAHRAPPAETPPPTTTPGESAGEPPEDAASVAWFRELDGFVYDDRMAVGLAPDGDILVAGLFTDDPNPRMALLQFSAEGDLEGRIQLGTGAVQPQDLVVADNGHAYIGGHYFGPVDLCPGPRVVARESPTYSTDSFVLHIDEEQELVDLWTFEGVDATVTVLEVERAADGSILVAGGYESRVDFDPGPGQELRTSNTASGRMEAFVAKLDPGGRLAWVHVFPNVGWVINHSICLGLKATPHGEVLLSARFGGDIDLDPGPEERLLSSEGTFILAFDAAGSLRWAHVVETPGGWACLDELAVEAGGDITAFGNFSGSIDLDPGPEEVMVSVERSSVLPFSTRLDEDGSFLNGRALEPELFTSGAQQIRELEELFVSADGSAFVASGRLDRHPAGDEVSLFTLQIGSGGRFYGSPPQGLEGAILRPYRIAGSDAGLAVVGSAIGNDPRPTSEEAEFQGQQETQRLFVAWLPLASLQ